MGWEDLGAGSEVALVEWPERGGDLLPEDRWEIELAIPGPAALVREVSVSRFGQPPSLPGFPVTLEGDGRGESE